MTALGASMGMLARSLAVAVLALALATQPAQAAVTAKVSVSTTAGTTRIVVKLKGAKPKGVTLVARAAAIS